MQVMSESETVNSAQRLCSEIQLFDLCDLSSCNSKNGRFCTNQELLGRFEKIADEEVRTPEYFISEENDDAEVDDEDEQFGYADGEAFSDDDGEDGEDGWDD